MEDSTSSAIAPTEEMEDKHKELVMDMFDKITEYLNGELAGRNGYYFVWWALFRSICIQ